jgi:general secretion pathway protein H
MKRPLRDRQAGMTLIEILAVLAVVGVAAAAIQLGFSDRSRSAEAEAVRLARHLSLGVDEAMIAGRPMALDWDAQGYRLTQRPAGAAPEQPQDWPAAGVPLLGMRHELAHPFEMALDDGTTAPVLLPVSGAATPVAFRIVGAGDAWTVTFDGFSATALPGGGS